MNPVQNLFDALYAIHIKSDDALDEALNDLRPKAPDLVLAEVRQALDLAAARMQAALHRQRVKANKVSSET